jgi:hypothetical protein
MAQGDAETFGFVQPLQRLVEVDQPRLIACRSRIVLARFDFRDVAGVPGLALQIEARGDALDPGGEGALAPELGAFLERLQECVLSDVVGLGDLRSHASQQEPHGRAVAAHQFAELPPSTRRREGGEFDVVVVHKGLGHDSSPQFPGDP